MGIEVGELVDHLVAETNRLREVLDHLPSNLWESTTVAQTWTIHDQVSHLGFFDEMAMLALSDPEAFQVRKAADLGSSSTDDLTEAVAAKMRAVGHHEVLRYFLDQRQRLVETLSHQGVGARVQWYGPEMSVASFVTARTMETWAHGQDIYDTLGVDPPQCAGLSDVVFLAHRSIPNSFHSVGLSPPVRPLRFTVLREDGPGYVLGPQDASDEVIGPERDFALVATQRRHPADTALTPTTPLGVQWLSVAQAFAGGRGAGRAPGQVGS